MYYVSTTLPQIRYCIMQYSEKVKGLSQQEAEQLQSILGKNKNSTTTENKTLFHLIQIGSDPLFLLLILCGALYFVLGDYQAGSIFLGWTILVGASTLYQQYRTQNALATLQKLAPAKSMVIRNRITLIVISSQVSFAVFYFIRNFSNLIRDGIRRRIYPWMISVEDFSF